MANAVDLFLFSWFFVRRCHFNLLKFQLGKSKIVAQEAKAVEEGYDYIIAGGGLAGCLLADRLSADGKKVLVLEAGTPDYNSMIVRIPAGVLRLFRNTKYDWQHETGGENACNGRNIFLQRGKVLGGSSCTNVCLHHRGSAQDYDDWGVTGWKASDVLPFFKASQKDTTGRSPDYHGTEGDWEMADVRYQNPLSAKFLEVGEKAGLGTNDDFNNWSRPQDGVGRFQVSESNGERCSGAYAFLSKAMKRKNCEVRTGTMVRRINFDGSKTATGVTYDLMGDDTMKVSFFFLFYFKSLALFFFDSHSALIVLQIGILRETQ